MRKIVLVYGGTSLLENQKERIKEKAKDFNLSDAEIIIQQGIALDKYDNLNDERILLKDQIHSLRQTLEKKESTIDSILRKEKYGEKLLGELKALYPQVVGASYSETYLYHDTISTDVRSEIIIIDTKSKLSNSTKTKIKNWVKKRLNSDNVKVIFE